MPTLGMSRIEAAILAEREEEKMLRRLQPSAISPVQGKQYVNCFSKMAPKIGRSAAHSSCLSAAMDEPPRYAVLGENGQVVAHARSAEAAHRATRRANMAGASVNMAGDWQAKLAAATTALRLERGEVVLFVGEPDTNLVMAARHAYQALPPFEPASQEQLVATEMARVARLGDGTPLVQRPFRAPHHTVSEAGLVGSAHSIGGEKRVRVGRRYETKKEPVVWRFHPGEVSLATGGVLMLDEVLEFRASALDAVAAALRDGQVVIERGFGAGQERQKVVFPASPYAVVMTTTADQLAKYGSNPRYGRILGLVTREVRVS